MSRLVDQKLKTSEGDKSIVDVLELAELEKQKAHKAKLKRNYVEAAQCFLKAAHILKEQNDEGSNYEQAVCFEEAYKAFKQGNELEKGLSYLEQAANKFLTSTSRATRGARLYDQLGEHYSSLGKKNQSRQELVKACKMYAKAAESYEVEGDSRSVYSIAHQAELASQLELYKEAIHCYDKIIPVASEDRLLQFKLKDYLFSYCLCVLAKDGWDEFATSFRCHQDLHPVFNSTRESQLLLDLIEAKNGFDLEKYEKTLSHYANLSPLPGWQLSILTKVKTEIQQEDLR
ncbi:TPR-like protein [Basidiobolus meristosporus CBS 931.73]|uniref:Gamma-soluble NSF attachment protein n=1 Tax=Basidiobolus meristosporus CBS 931.73 TaxID=1314790 RepID=A0A1Y1YQZ4_9FUNG|nr:TPR-like protein [Basidiobolus meristosporus CBS 931.73]|eukprot:ORX99984.1 TPR-like protein [Basidiobolus meristosporus CBS 931.73]